MTLPVVPPGPLSMSQINTEIQQSSTALISLNDTTVRTVAGVTTPNSQISFTNFSGKAYTVPGNSGILTSGSSYTLPATSGLTVNILFIAGGAGGGGGTGRNANYNGWNTGGGGGGSGGNGYQTAISVTPGQSISFSIGGGGSAGQWRDGVYTSGSNGGTGGTTSVTINGTTYSCSGGSGGLVAPNASGGGAGGTGGIGYAIAPTSGGSAGSGNQIGGFGAKGYTINTTVGLSIGSIIGYGNSGQSWGPFQSGSQPATAGTIYGAGGSGGGSCQSDQTFTGNQIAAAGTSGAVFIWWGY